MLLFPLVLPSAPESPPPPPLAGPGFAQPVDGFGAIEIRSDGTWVLEEFVRAELPDGSTERLNTLLVSGSEPSRRGQDLLHMVEVRIERTVPGAPRPFVVVDATQAVLPMLSSEAGLRIDTSRPILLESPTAVSSGSLTTTPFRFTSSRGRFSPEPGLLECDEPFRLESNELQLEAVGLTADFLASAFHFGCARNQVVTWSLQGNSREPLEGRSDGGGSLVPFEDAHYRLSLPANSPTQLRLPGGDQSASGECGDLEIDLQPHESGWLWSRVAGEGPSNWWSSSAWLSGGSFFMLPSGGSLDGPVLGWGSATSGAVRVAATDCAVWRASRSGGSVQLLGDPSVWSATEGWALGDNEMVWDVGTQALSSADGLLLLDLDGLLFADQVRRRDGGGARLDGNLFILHPDAPGGVLSGQTLVHRQTEARLVGDPALTAVEAASLGLGQGTVELRFEEGRWQGGDFLVPGPVELRGKLVGQAPGLRVRLPASEESAGTTPELTLGPQRAAVTGQSQLAGTLADGTAFSAQGERIGLNPDRLLIVSKPERDLARAHLSGQDWDLRSLAGADAEGVDIAGCIIEVEPLLGRVHKPASLSSGELQLRASQIAWVRTDRGELVEVTAERGATLKSALGRARADRIHYLAATEELLLTGSPETPAWLQLPNGAETQAEWIRYHLPERLVSSGIGRATVESGP